MPETPLWKLVQNNRFLQPFQVRDEANRSLLHRARWWLVCSLLALLVWGVFSSRDVNLLINRDELENAQSHFVSLFYPTYDSLYYWLKYQGNIASELHQALAAGRSGEDFWNDWAAAVGELPGVTSVQFGQVGVNSQWLASRTTDGWELSAEINQDFAAWLLTQELATDRIYWAQQRLSGQPEIGLFWLEAGSDGEQVYFLVNVEFDYADLLQSVPAAGQQLGAAIFLGEHHQQVFPFLAADFESTASTTARLASERADLQEIRSATDWNNFLADEILSRFRETGKPFFDVTVDHQNFWIKISPVATQTGYEWLAVVLRETEPLAKFGLPSSWVRGAMLVLIGIFVITFLINYWRFSRRYFFTNQIRDIIKDGENGRLEFKSSLRYDLKAGNFNRQLENAILKSIAAFNNTDGGLLIIGVSDTGEILGLADDYSTLKKPDKDGFELHLRDLVAQAYGQHFAARRIEIFFPLLAGREICVVKVKKGRSALYTDITDKNGNKAEKFYIRMGNSSREIEKLSDIVDYQNQRFKWRFKLGKK